ncbi:RHOMBOID-like protein 2 [Elaeis guineensis]|uniref:RHOMBOID-like protein n=1 Tax=Elaeis guineensis var. tenera TaxID=51953 RepID=A0A6I9R8G4_ELAGV|nr:RHOMBOID-like protein 2 [Elaeis guineensis]
MGRETSSEIEVVVSQTRGDNAVHPLEADRTAPPPAPEQPQVRSVRRWVPWLVPVFVVANVVMFLVTMYVNNCLKNSPRPCVAPFLGRFAFNSLRENPLVGPSSSALEKMGALDVTKVVKEHQGWRLITCIWLHAGVIHLLANMLGLLLIGVRLEQEFGFVRIGMLYVMSGFGGSVLSALFIQSRISVGASGALFGFLGGMLSELITNWTIYANKFTALLTLIFIIAINLAVGLLPHVDNFAHIGGFISGFLLGFVFLVRPQFGWISQKNVPSGYHTGSLKRKHNIYQYTLWIIGAIFLIVGFTVGLIMLFRGVNANDHCSWCHYITCVPTSKWSCKPSMICFSAQDEHGLNLTCQGYGRNLTYFFPSSSETRIKELCNQICS